MFAFDVCCKEQLRLSKCSLSRRCSLARHAIFSPQREEPKEHLRGRLIEVDLLENIRPERKVAP